MKGIITALGGSLVQLSFINLVEAAEVELNYHEPSTFTLTIPAQQNIPYQQELTSLKAPVKMTGNVQPTQIVQLEVITQAFASQRLKQAQVLTFQLVDRAGNHWHDVQYTEEQLTDGKEQQEWLKIKIIKEIWDKANPGNYEGALMFKATLKMKQ